MTYLSDSNSWLDIARQNMQRMPFVDQKASSFVATAIYHAVFKKSAAMHEIIARKRHLVTIQKAAQAVVMIAGVGIPHLIGAIQRIKGRL